MIPLKEVENVGVLRERVSSLRAQRGMALMDGKGNEVEELTAEIEGVGARVEALEDLEAAESRRRLEAQTEEREKNRGLYEKQLDHFTEKAIGAVANAETAMRTFVSAYKSARSLYYAAAQLKHQIDGKIPTPWNLHEMNSRFGFRVGALLATIDSKSLQRLGPVSWHLHGSHGSDCSWVELETDILKRETK